MKQARIIDITTGTNRAELQAYSEEHPRTEERPKALALGAIHVADGFFQRRDLDANRVEHEVHVRELVRILRDTRKAFGPLVVTPVGDRFYVVDGHYRLTAYRSVGWSRKVPVVVFDGTLEEAWRKSLELNVRNKRPMSLADKLEAAWVMTCRGLYTKAQVAEECAVAEGTVRNMRRRLRELEAKGQDPAEMSWRQAKHGGPKEELAEEDWLEKQASEWADRLLKAFGSKARERPDILALALAKVDAGLPRVLVGEWGHEARELVDEWNQELDDPEAPF